MDDVRTYGGKNGKKEGKLFSIHILDESDLIVATFFDGAVDKWYNKIQLGRIYSFTGA
jgi:replication factor A1